MATTRELIVRAKWEGRDLERGAKRGKKEIDAFSGAVKLAGRAMAGIGFLIVARQAQQYADTMVQVTNRVRLFTSSQAEANRVVQELLKASNATRVSLESSAELYQRLAQANKQLGLNQKDLLAVMTSINRAIRISGVSAEAANAAIIQLGQGLASGALRGEELRSVLEQTPRLALAIAEGLGVTITQLREMGAAGQLNARRVISALQRQADVLDKEFSKVDITIGESFVVLNNNLIDFIGNLAKTTGAAEGVAGAILGIANAVKTVNDALPTREGAANFLRGSLSFLAPQGELTQAQRDHIRRTRDQSGATRFRAAGPGGTAFLGRSRTGFGLGGGGGAPQLDRRLGAGQLDKTLASRSQQQIGREVELQNRLREEQANAIENQILRERALLALRQQIEMEDANRRDVGRAELTLLKEVHIAERQALEIQERVNGEKRVASRLLALERDAAKEANRQRQEQRKVELALLAQRRREAQIVNGLNSVLSRLVPQMRGFFDAAASLSKGDTIGAVINGVHGILDMFGVVRQDSSGIAEEMRRLSDAMRSAETTAQGLLESLPATSKAMEAMQKDALVPLQRVLSDYLSRGGNPIDELRAFFRELASIDAQGMTPVLRRLGIDLVDLTLNIRDAFGDDATFVEAGRKLLQFSEAADKTSNALDRQIRLQFDVEEIALRTQAQRAFTRAGADPFEQAKVFQRLGRQIGSLSARERAAGRSGGGAAGGADLTGPLNIDLGNLEFSGKRGISDFDEIVAFEEGAQTINSPWSNAVTFTQSSLTTDFGISHYNQIIAFEGNVEKIRVPWSFALNMTISKLMEGYGVTHFNQMIAFEGAIGKIRVPWANALHFRASTLAAYGIGSFHQLVNFVGDLTKISVPVHHILHVDTSQPVTVNLNEVVRFTGTPRRVSVRDVIDMSDLRGMVEDINQRSTRDRTTDTRSNLSGISNSPLNELITSQPSSLSAEEMARQDLGI